MAYFSSPQPVPADYPNLLKLPEPQRPVLRPAGWLLVGLVLLCLVPRTIMAVKVQSVCPDGLFYIRLAEALERGNFNAAFDQLRLNTFPLILAGLHHLGLDWELAGKLWGVAISSLTVLPLFGWARRQFDDRVALTAALLYAFHPKLIIWSPELIRDPTFWFLFVLSLYLLWRAVTEVRPLWFVAAGLAATLAFATRFEGMFLALPLLLWSLGRFRGLKSGRGRLVLGMTLCLLVLPGVLVLVNATLLHGHPRWEFSRMRPLGFAYTWVQSLAGVEPTPATAPDFAVQRMSTAELAWTFLHMGESGLTPLFALLMFGGIWRWRRVWIRIDHQPLFYTALAVAFGMLIHLWYAQGSANRYILPIVFMGSAFAALAVLGLSGWLARRGQRLGWTGLRSGPMLLAVLAVFAAVGCTDVIASDCRLRNAEPWLGHWIRERAGHAPLVYGSGGITDVVGYYAQGETLHFSAGLLRDGRRYDRLGRGGPPA